MAPVTLPRIGTLRWFCRRFLLICVNPFSEWKSAALEEIAEGDIFKGYILRSALLSPLLMAPFVFLPNFQLGPVVGVLSCFFIYGINIALAHLYAVVFEAVAGGIGGKATRISALKLSAYSLSPWHFALGLFPFIHALALLGLLWSFFIFVIGSREMVTVPDEHRWKFLALASFLCVVLLLLSNLFFAGVLGMIVGPQVPPPQA